VPTLIAHRGFAGEQPENTLGAFRAAAGVAEAARDAPPRSVADAVELDVRRCGTGELVVLHDATLDRVTDLTGPVAETPYASLADCDVLGSGEGVPRLADVFDALPPAVGVNVELKTPDVAADAVALAAAAPHDVLVSSFDPDALRRAAGAGEVPLALLYRADGAEGAVDRALSLGCSAVHPPTGVADAELVDEAHANGLDVNVWTVRARPAARRVTEAGVDGLIADRSDVLG
jgi:glycerophosphoryl diester phosphodiesterase